MGRGSLYVRDLSVTIDRTEVFSDLSLSLPLGKRTALLGANGSGKTTLLRCLSGALRPRSGEVSLVETRLGYSKRELDAWRTRVQLVRQNADEQLFAPDVWRDVSFGPVNQGLPAADVEARTRNVLARLSLLDLASTPIHHLSAGQRKRVAIAGVLAMKPDVILLDEPTAGLDPAGTEEFLSALQAAEDAGATALITTHDVDLALQWADRVAVLVGGLVVEGEPLEVLSDSDLLRRARLRPSFALEVLERLGVEPTAVLLRDAREFADAIIDWSADRD